MSDPTACASHGRTTAPFSRPETAYDPSIDHQHRGSTTTMNRTARAAALAATTTLLLAACGGNSDPAAETTPAAEVDVEASAEETTDESDSWPIVEDEDGNVVENPEDEPMDEGWPVIEPGEWGDYSGLRNDIGDDGLEPLPNSEMQVRLASTECGLTSIENAVSNPVYYDDENWVDGEPQVPEYIPAEAEPGKEFCIFTIDYRNVGSEPYGTDEPAGVMLDNGDYHEQSETDHDISWTIQDYVIDLNPGDEGQYRHVVSIPEGSTPLELWYPAETLFSGPTMSFLIDG